MTFFFRALAFVFLIVLGSLFASSSSAISPYETRTIPVGMDFYVDNTGSYPRGDEVYAENRNWVGHLLPYDGYDYGLAESALKFDLSDIPGKVSVSEAKLRIFVYDVLEDGTEPAFLTVFGSHNVDWEETSATIPSKDVPIFPERIPIGAGGKWLEVDVTGFVQSRMSADKIVSLVLTGNTDGDRTFNFNSKESVNNQPELLITYGTYSDNANLSQLEWTDERDPNPLPLLPLQEVNVAHSVDRISLTATAEDGSATIRLNGTRVSSGMPVLVPLAVGGNPVAIEVTAEDGTTARTYQVSFNRAASSNADLASLDASGVSWTPPFSPSQDTYEADVAYEAESVTLTPGTADAGATLKINGIAHPSGTPRTMPLAVGVNPIEIEVTAQDGTTIRTYSFNVTRAAPSGSAHLSGLELSEGELSPEFNADVFAYSVEVGNAVTSVTVKPTVADATATVKVQGEPVESGVEVPVNLSVGDNEIVVEVTAQDGTTVRTYAVTVTRAPSSNASLSGLELSEGELSPEFDVNVLDYTATVGHAERSITVKPTVADTTATVKVQGESVESGTDVPISLSVGDNVVDVEVTAQDGTTVLTYAITVTRAPSSNASLSGLELSEGELSPAFNADVFAYSVEIGNAVTSVTVRPTVADATATVKVQGEPVESGVEVPVNLSVGDNVVDVEVTAQDGTTVRTYTVTVTRAPSSNASLSGLELSEGELSPEFDVNVLDYTATVGHAERSITVKPTVADTTATVKVQGESVESGTAVPVSLSVGDNVVEVEVTAQDGTTVRTYTVTVTRAPSSNASLSGLELSEGELSPEFDVNVLDYTATVGHAERSITVKPTVADTTATVKVQGESVESGTDVPISLSVGDNVVEVEVAAQDGTTVRTYTVTVTRTPSSNAALSNLELSEGELLPEFSADVLVYSAKVGNAVTSITVKPTVADATTTVKVRGETVDSGVEVPVSLSVGDNVVEVEVTAQDGTTVRTYTVTVTRMPSSNAALSNLELSESELLPEFNTDVFVYSVEVGNAVTSVTVKPTVADATATVKVLGEPVESGADVPISLSVGDNEIVIEVTAQDGAMVRTYTVKVKRANAPAVSNPGAGGGSGAPSGSGATSTPPSRTNVPIKVEVVIEAGMKHAIVQMTEQDLSEALENLPANAALVISVTESADRFSIDLKEGGYSQLLARNATLRFETPLGSYSLPASALDWDTLLKSIGHDVTLTDIGITLEIASVTAEERKLLLENADNESYEIAVPPLEFSIRLSALGREFPVESFLTFIELRIPIPPNIDPERIATAVVGNPDGSVRHVPTSFEVSPDGTRTAVISSLTNSIFVLVRNERTFEDVRGHWAETAIQDLAKRLIVQGKSDQRFSPESTITRAEFAAIVVRALGLRADGHSVPFSDVGENSWYRGTIGKAAEYGLIAGYADGSFRPHRTITRQEALVILSRAIQLSKADMGIQEHEVDTVLSAFPDRERIEAWAKTAVAWSIRANIAQGTSDGFRPARSITRAETAVLIQRWLAVLKLID
ncbi:cadherin-like beta sandwich domain-containing protein [Paenibacillaceae bacterium WGS1546]|uniref:cadherin-like beta sandwich domain-containing protein n=1 Tax=Cohnella sp. WGS1546 TaxID=3366810 RepID=UPI00372D29E9